MKNEGINYNGKISSRSIAPDDGSCNTFQKMLQNNIIGSNSPNNINHSGSINGINMNSSNSNLSSNMIKIKKLKIINPSMSLKSTNLQKNPGKKLSINAVLNSKYERKMNTGPINSILNNKLTFDNVFNFKQSIISPSIVNQNLNGSGNINNINNSNPSSITNSSSNPNINQIQINNSPLVINNAPSQPQISININNFNINNYNINSNKVKKNESQTINNTPISVLAGNSSTTNLKSSDSNVKLSLSGNSQNKLNFGKINIVDENENFGTFGVNNGIGNIIGNCNSMGNSIGIGNSIGNGNGNNIVIVNGNANGNGFGFGNNLSSNSALPLKFKIAKELSPKKHKANVSNKKLKNKIETIIDGNNDSFINELADLLNNVEKKNTKNEELIEGEHIKNEDNQHQIEFEKRELYSHKRPNEFYRNNSNEKFDPNFDNQEMEEIGINLQEYINKKEKGNVEILKDEYKEDNIPDPRINFAQLQIVNSKRPQTSYGGLSARQKSLQQSLRQKSSKVYGYENRNEELFPMPNGDHFNDNLFKNVINIESGINLKNKLSKNIK